MAFVDDRAVTVRADEKTRDFVDRLLRRRQPDAPQRRVCHLVQPLERQREVRASPASDDRMNFVDDDGPHGAEHFPAALRRQQQIQRLRRRHKNVRRGLEDLRAFRRGGVARAHGGGNRRRLEPHRCRELLNAQTRNREVLVNVGAERLQRRDVDDADFVGERSAQTFLKQIVESSEKRRERLA